MLKIKRVNIKKLKFKRAMNVSYLLKHIKEFGLLHPIIVNKSNVVLDGNCRVVAFKKLGYKTIPCIVVEGTYP